MPRLQADGAVLTRWRRDDNSVAGTCGCLSNGRGTKKDEGESSGRLRHGALLGEAGMRKRYLFGLRACGPESVCPEEILKPHSCPSERSALLSAAAGFSCRFHFWSTQSKVLWTAGACLAWSSGQGTQCPQGVYSFATSSPCSSGVLPLKMLFSRPASASNQSTSLANGSKPMTLGPSATKFESALVS